MERIAQLKKFIETSPEDPFPRYGLALEYCNQGKLSEAQSGFDDLLSRFPDYLPAYLMAGGNLVALERQREARGVFKRGIALAAKLGDANTKSELEAALADLGE